MGVARGLVRRREDVRLHRHEECWWIGAVARLGALRREAMTDLAKVRGAMTNHFKSDRDRLVADLNWAIVEIERLRAELAKHTGDICSVCHRNKKKVEHATDF
jgi:hypothetical protein